MSSPTAPAVPFWRPLTTTERNWLWALVAAVLFGVVLWGAKELESRGASLHKSERFVASPAEASAKFLAVAHTIVATAFMATSRRLATRRGRTWVAGLAVLGVAICFGYAALAQASAALAAVCFTAYFIAHDVRDETFFYAANGDAGPSRVSAGGPGRLATTILATVLVATLGAATAFGIGGARRYMGPLASVDLGVRAAIGVAIVLLCLATTLFVARREGVRRLADWHAFFTGHRPIVLVTAGTYVVLFVGLALTDRMYAIVSLHIVLWWIFAGRRLAEAPRRAPAPRPLTWRWVRETPTGFHLFHGGVLALVVGAGALWAFAWKNDPAITALRLLAGKDSFYYWTLMHVTLSWVPRV